MPQASAVNDKWQVVIEGRQEGQLTANVFHFVCVGADTDVDTHLILVLLNCFITHLLPVLSSSWTLERVRWQKVGPTLGIEQISIPTGGAAAGGGAASLPSFCAAVISKRTLTPGRSGRGRTFIPAIPEGQVTGSAIDTAGPLWAGLLAFAVCVIDAFVHPDPAGGSAIYNMAVLSRKIGGTHAPYTSGFSDIREYVPVQQIATQRSRKVGRGA